MVNTIYLYSFFVLLCVGSIFYFIQNFRPTNQSLSNKILLKNLLEGLDMDLPEELKALDSSTTDPQKLS
tara:strand:+ start:197 stop:403 length:207 start_codon:yes stop_codon:yes gene_type:complete